MNAAVECTRCGAVNRAAQYFCSKCGLNLHTEGAARAIESEVPEPSPTVHASSGQSPLSYRASTPALTSRYRDGFVAAGLIVALGLAVKVVGVILGVILFLASLSAVGDLGWRLVIVGWLVDVFVAGVLFILGIMISAQGQILRAVLDTAVNTSPLLEHQQKISLLG